MGTVFYCLDCGDNYWSANSQLKAGDACQQCGGTLAEDRREPDAAPPSPDRRGRPPVHATP